VPDGYMQIFKVEDPVNPDIANKMGDTIAITFAAAVGYSVQKPKNLRKSPLSLAAIINKRKGIRRPHIQRRMLA
jgi:hypothetical protein